ncbi:MAG: T9SS type A sorting domain-containing protein, partial [Bacteroidota bacterium]
ISIAIDSVGNKWIATYYGVTELNASDVWVRNFRHKEGLYNNYVQDLDFDSKGNLWMGIYADYLQDGGITKYSGTSFESNSVWAGLVNVMVKRLAIDQQDNIWIATGSGVSKMKDKGLGINNLDRQQEFSIGPNPAQGYFIVNHREPVFVKITDISGRMVTAQNLGKDENRIAIDNFVPGTYFVNISIRNNCRSQKLIIR